MKFLRILCVVAVALCLAGSVYAETQSVKVSGDLTMRYLGRDSYNYRGSIVEPSDTRNMTGTDNSYTWFMSTAEVEVDADLTDNVQTVIRLVNQRDWNVDQNKAIVSGTTLAMNGLGGYTYNPDEYQVAVDLAYVTLKDFIYAPLTLTIGRQDIWLGKGFIIGLNQQNPTGSIRAVEYTAINSFDAIKAVLDYDPWTITALYANIYTNVIPANDDRNLWGVNVGYKFNQYKAEAEGYWFYRQDSTIETWVNNKKGNNDTNVLGLRGSVDPIDWVTLAGEGAFQFGNYVGSRFQFSTRSRQAYALDFSGEVRYFTSKYAWKPKFGAEYILYSGQPAEDGSTSMVGSADLYNGVGSYASGTYHGWDPMYRGKFDSKIREFVGRYYASSQYPVRNENLYSCVDSSFMNQNQMIFSGSVQPIDSVLLKANYNLFWNQYAYLQDNSSNPYGRKTLGFIGQELDFQANWDYTEDVSFNILGAYFVPGEVYTVDNKPATEVVGTVSVSF